MAKPSPNKQDESLDDQRPDVTVADRLAEAGEQPSPGAPETGAPATSAGETLSRGADVVEP